jgi:hypothetical protein
MRLKSDVVIVGGECPNDLPKQKVDLDDRRLRRFHHRADRAVSLGSDNLSFLLRVWPEKMCLKFNVELTDAWIA